MPQPSTAKRRRIRKGGRAGKPRVWYQPNGGTGRAAVPLAALAADNLLNRGGRRRKPPRGGWRPTSAAFSLRARSLRLATPPEASPFLDLEVHGTNLEDLSSGEDADLENLAWLNPFGSMLETLNPDAFIVDILPACSLSHQEVVEEGLA